MTRKSELEIERNEHDDRHAVVYRLAGRLIGSPRCYEFLEEVREDIRDGRVHVILDVGGLERVTSAGIGIVAAVYTSAKNAEGSLAVASAPGFLTQLLEIVCLRDLIPVFATEAEALAALA